MVKQRVSNGEKMMALGILGTPTYNISCRLELPRQNWCLHNSSLSSLIVRRSFLRRVQLPSTCHLPPYPRLPRVSVLAISLWKQYGLVNEEGNEANNSSTFELSNGFLDFLKQRSKSGLSNDIVELEGKDVVDNWYGNNVDSFVRRRRGGHDYMERTQNYEVSSEENTGSSNNTEEEDWLWSAGERRNSKTWTLDENSKPTRNTEAEHWRGVRSGGPKLTLPKSHPSIPAKFSKYTRWKNANRGKSRSVIVKQQMEDINVENQPYYKEKAVFFQDFTPAVIKPEQPCQFSYSEHPNVPPIGFREPVYSPFGPESMVRPWTGKQPYVKSVRIEFDSFKLPPSAMTKARFVEPPGPFLEGTGPKLGRTREEILGEPLSKDEVRELVQKACSERRQLDLGKDGLTHNMLDLLHRHWKRRRICRIKCYGVPTVDMDNLCRVIEAKSGGKIIRRSRGVLYVFRGRNYNWNTRPQIPIMLWKPPAPIYPPVVQNVPEGSSVEEADNLRALGRRSHCLCRLKRAGVYLNLVKTVKDAFEIDELVKVDCRELERSDMKKIGAKLRDLVPCVPLSFDRHFMLLWKGSKLHGGSQNKGEGDTSGAGPDGVNISENGKERWPETLQDEESEVFARPENCSNQKDEQVKGDVDTDAEETGIEGDQNISLTLHGARFDHKFEDVLPQGQVFANVRETTNFTAENELASSSDNEGRASCNDNTGGSADIDTVFKDSEEAALSNDDMIGDQVKKHAMAKESSSINATAVMRAEEAALEFDRLWQEAINSNEVVMLDESEEDLDSILEKVNSHNGEIQKRENTLGLWEEKPLDSRGTSNLESEECCKGDTPLLSPWNGDAEGTNEEDSSETDEGYDEDENTFRMWRELSFSSGGDADEYEKDDEQPEEAGNAEELLPSSMTDITIPQDELKRLCALRQTIRGWMTIGTQGISRGIVKSIHSKWLVSEIAKVRCVVPGWNMRKLHDDLERLTGGIVIWMEGPAVLIYRGQDYVPGWMRKMEEREEAYRELLQSLELDEEVEGEQLNESETSYKTQIGRIREADIEDLMSGLGPQYIEWTEDGYVPIDGDLLMNLEFKTPFRLLPHGMRPRLTNLEMTEMRHLVKKLRSHFVLGKRRGLEGLASAIVKLWEKSEVVKVAMKRGVSRIDNDRMAEELMRLTGGDLITRNMTYIALFRGNSFLPPVVKRNLEEKDQMARTLLEEEEKVRLAGFYNASRVVDAPLKISKAGTLAETLEEKAKWNPWHNSEDCSTRAILVRKAARDQALQRMQKILNSITQKIGRAERELQNLNLKVRPKGRHVAKEYISEEEMYSLRKIGLRQKPYLLLGRREVFGGIIENMHLHWKWRELVKIIVKKSYFMYRERDKVEEIARMLEIESGGVLVGICTIPVGEAIIVYRGKNYQRPVDGISPQGHPDGLRPRGLLTKKQAWQRFNQKRRKQSLEKHLYKLERDFNMIRADLENVEEAIQSGQEGADSES